RRWSANITNRVDVWHVRATIFIDHDEPAAVHLDAREVETKPLDIRDASKRREHFVRNDALAVRKDHFALQGTREAVVMNLLDPSLSQIVPTKQLELRAIRIRELGIEKRHGSWLRVNHGDLHAESGEDRCVLARNNASAENRERTRKIGHRQDRVAIEDVLVI